MFIFKNNQLKQTKKFIILCFKFVWLIFYHFDLIVYILSKTRHHNKFSSSRLVSGCNYEEVIIAQIKLNIYEHCTLMWP